MRLPRPSTTRFILLVLMTCAAASFATYWWFIELRGNWLTEQAGCLTRLGQAGSVAAFNSCIDSVVLRQEGVVLLGPLAIVLAAVLVTIALVPVMLLIWGAAPPGARVRANFEASLARAGIARRSRGSRRPRLVAARRPVRGTARVFGSFPRYWVVTDAYLVSGTDEQLRAILAHELAHLRAGDIDRARLARSVWVVFFLVVAPALVISVAAQGGLAWVAVGVRLLVLTILIHLTYLALLRAREYEADLLAAEPSLARVLAAQHQPRGFRALVPEFLRSHPAPARRLRVLSRAALAARLPVAEFLSTGIAVGVVFQELAFAAGALLPGSRDSAYWITGAMMAVPMCLVTVTALWRHELAGPGRLRLPAVAAAGMLLGAGLLAGSQLSPRAATDWGTVQYSVAPALPSNMSLQVAGFWGIAALAAAAIAGGCGYALWLLALARLRLGRRLATVLAIAVVAVPMGTWFEICRMAADSVDGPQGTPIGDLLHGRVLLTALAVTGVTALMPVVLSGRWQQPAMAAACCAVAVLIPLAPWVAGGAFLDAVTPGPPLTSGPSDVLPLLPPQMVQGREPLNTGLMCFVMAQVSAQDQAKPAIWRQIGLLLRRTPDRGMDTIGGALVRAAVSSSRGVGLAKQAWLAARYRCDVLLDTPTPAYSP